MKKYKILVLLIACSVLIPLLANIFIFGNSFSSNVDNNGWAGFLGSFWGAIIGGGCTCWAVIKQKDYSDQEKQKEDIEKIRPYIIAENPKLSDSGRLTFDVLNIGLNSACDIQIYAKDQAKPDEWVLIENGKYCLTVNSKVHVCPDFNFDDTMFYQFRYIDLRDNWYHQQFRYNEKSKTFTPLKPEYIKTLKY